LWGVGLTEAVSGHSQLLHDGRARNLLEAVLWHGGESQAARDQVLTFNAEHRAALLAFLNSP
ncbi:di-heme oxidoredictase family protein, partial [Pseudomonas sp.]|uniref:di-heme oxidoredictase family protein n=1 Tax=Pseudomonas sp. TaxID=306 RepID=UPI002897E2C9